VAGYVCSLARSGAGLGRKRIRLEMVRQTLDKVNWEERVKRGEYNYVKGEGGSWGVCSSRQSQYPDATSDLPRVGLHRKWHSLVATRKPLVPLSLSASQSFQNVHAFTENKYLLPLRLA